MEADLKALAFALSLAIRIGHRLFIFESDSVEVLDLFYGKTQCPDHLFQTLSKCWKWLARLEHWNLRAIYSEANVLADGIASYAVRHRQQWLRIDSSPGWFREA